MKARVFVLAAVLAATVSLSAQGSEPNESIRYSNVTEFGFVTASPQGVGLEATTAHGISLNKQHHFGLGFGIGVSFRRNSNPNPVTYMPVFLNYRLYFRPEKTFSPHVNISAGGIALEESVGGYASITMGFRAGKFSFSSGLSVMPIYREVETVKYYDNPYGGSLSYSVYEEKWVYPFGITLKWGFSF